ncbi:SDR family NAD(P)-dependent oxidoreductase [Isoptericola halotolerans]|uniref:SDR family NAD(P)-dependent oxidoreductase n=1 Tax=Isoptericola halotolerans TaxID=300560 RepID=UPI00388EC3FE
MDTENTSASHPTPTGATTVALVTGATRGIGGETARRLAALGWTVWLGARDLAVGRTVAAELGGDVRALSLDVTRDDSVADAATTVAAESGRLDVLVNNAGISGELVAPPETLPDHFLDVFGVNVLGPVRTTHTFLPLLRAADQPRVVMVSSGLGSFARTTDPGTVESQFASITYPASKAALNMVTSQYARSLPGFQVNAVDPGYTATDLNGHQGEQTVEEGARSVVRAATLTADGPTGQFLDALGTVPW